MKVNSFFKNLFQSGVSNAIGRYYINSYNSFIFVGILCGKILYNRDISINLNIFLFIAVDPSERVNLASRHPEIVDDLRVRLAEYMKTTYHIHLQSQQPDPAGNAVNFGGVWSPGWC